MSDSARTVRTGQVVAKTVLGTGVGVVTAVFATAAIISVFETVLPALLITKAAGMVGGAAGLIKGLSDDKAEKVVNPA